MSSQVWKESKEELDFVTRKKLELIFIIIKILFYSIECIMMALKDVFRIEAYLQIIKIVIS